jgi:AGZA family xanthine/uracil permease-like MFS transporter
MLGFGSNTNGFLSHGDQIPRITPQQGMSPSQKLICVSCGSRTTFVVTSSNQLFGCGSTVAGQLGDPGDDGDVHSLRRVNVENVVAVATRGAHVLACDINGYMYAWGRGDEGYSQAGKNGVPRLISMPVKIKKVAVGKMHSIAMDNFGQVWSWGMSGEGQTGQDTAKPILEPSLVVNLDGRATDISCGSRHTLVLTEGKMAFGFGGNSYSQLGLPNLSCAMVPTLISGSTRVNGIACGYRHSMFWTETRTVYGCGWNSHGQAVPSIYESVVSTPCEVECLGEDEEVLSIAGGGRHTLMARRSPQMISVVGWGRGAAGELASPIQDEVRIPRVILVSKEINDKPGMACGWEHSVLTSPAAIKSYVSGSLTDAPPTPIMEYLSHRLGDVDAALAQLTNAVVLLKFLNPPGKARAALLTTACSNLAFSAWGFHKNATSLPHGLSTIAVFLFQTQVYLPILARSTVEKATSACMFCTMWIAILEIISSFGIAKYIGQRVPRAALLACMAGVGLVFIATNFTAQMFMSAHAGLAPFLIFLSGFAAREKMPLGIPVAVVALALGWLLSNGTEEGLLDDVYAPNTVNIPLWDCMTDSDNYVYFATIVVPLFIVTIVSNLACVEFAKASGDEYDESMALFLDGVASLTGVVAFGNCVPCCIYLGSVGFKAWGATFWYTLFDSAVMFLLAFEYSPLVSLLSVIPRVSAIGMLVYIGLLVAGDSFKAKKHITAIVFGLVPAVAAYHMPTDGTTNEFSVIGNGYMLISMIFASSVSLVIDRRYTEATMWFIGAAAATIFGLIHATQTEDCVVGYLTSACVCGLFAFAQWQRGELEDDIENDQGYLAGFKTSDSNTDPASVHNTPVANRRNSFTAAPPGESSTKVRMESPLTKTMSLGYGSTQSR